MCANYEPIRLADIAKLGLPQPTFDFVNEAFPQDLCPILVAGHQADLEWRQAIFTLIPAKKALIAEIEPELERNDRD